MSAAAENVENFHAQLIPTINYTKPCEAGKHITQNTFLLLAISMEKTGIMAFRGGKGESTQFGEREREN